MKAWIIGILAALALAGCLSQPARSGGATDLAVQTGSTTGLGGVHVYATLAEHGSVEWVLAPLYTRTARIADTAKRRLAQGRLPAHIAGTIAAQTRGGLDRIREARGEVVPDVYEARVAQAKALLDAADELLEDFSK